MQAIPENLRSSLGLQFVVSQGWNWQGGDGGQIQIEICPFCNKSGWKFYMAVANPAESNRDGLYFCHHGSCAKTGNLRTLQEALGVRIPGVESRKDWAGKGDSKPDALPDVDVCHATLLGDADALDYLLNVRGFTQEIIDRQKLGLKEKVWFRDAGETKALVIPYLVDGNIVYAKYRTLPPKPKDFVSPSGHSAPLYNGEILKEGCQEIIFVEGEADALSLLSNGIENVVGVPGANVKKADWIDKLDKVAPEHIYILYDNDKVGIKAAQEIASRIGIDKALKLTLPPFEIEDVDGKKRPGKDVNEWFTKGGGNKEKFEELKKAAALFDVTGVASATDALGQLEDELNGRFDLAPRYVTQWPELNRLIGFEDGDVIDVVAPEKVGKSGRLSSLVKTPTGWKRNGDLKVGDELASVDGVPSFVNGVFPQGVLEMFKVTFSDGRSTEVSAEHLWKVCHVNIPDTWRVYTTDAIMSEYGRNQTGNGQRIGNLNKQLYIPLVSGDFGSDCGLPIDPWLLGVLLGDGGLTNGTPLVTNVDDELLVRLTNVCAGYGLALNRTESDSTSYRLSAPASGGTKENPITKALRKLEVWGHRAEDKFIPTMYLNASKESRWELLRGLMDTDGTAGNKYGTASYTSVSKQLALDVQHLVRSLGGVSRVSAPTKKSFRYKGELRTGLPAYRVSVLMPKRDKLFSLARKLTRVKSRCYQPRLTFTHIESIGFHEAQCISVTHPSKLYITDDYIVTHNTTFGLNLLDHMVSKYGEDGLLVCLEMTQARLARKWVALVTGFEDTITEPGTEESKAKLQELKDACVKARFIQQGRAGDIYFAYPLMYQDNPDVIFKLIKDCVRRYGVKWVMFDNLQKFADDTLKNQAHRTIHLSQLSKKFATLAKDSHIKLIRILQPKRIEKGSIISTNDVDGSSQVAKDCDGMITLWRSTIGGDVKKSAYEEEAAEFEETFESFDPKMKVTVGLSRYSPGGSAFLYYDGARSQVKSYDSIQKQKVDYNKLVTAPAPLAVPTEGEVKI